MSCARCEAVRASIVANAMILKGVIIDDVVERLNKAFSGFYYAEILHNHSSNPGKRVTRIKRMGLAKSITIYKKVEKL